MLTFAWNIRDRALLRLTGWFLLLMVMLSVVFIIFRITYPAMVRADATSQRIIVLDPADPAALAIIHRAQDKSFGLMPSEADDAASEAGFPSFSPSFSGVELELRPAPSIDKEQDSTRPVFHADARNLLPTVPRRATLPPQTPPRSVLRLLLSADVAKRSPKSLQLDHIELADPAALLIRVLIDETGRVLQVLPLCGNESPATLAALQTQLSAIHFAPAVKSPRTYATLGFRWEKSGVTSTAP